MMSDRPSALMVCRRSVSTNLWHPGHMASVQTRTSTLAAEATAARARRRREAYWGRREEGGREGDERRLWFRVWHV